VRDALGNKTVSQATASVDVLVLRDGERLRMVIARILQRSAAILTKYPGYKITIEGHAVMVYWYDPAKGRQEQASVLVPLSKARAEAVKKALVDLGVSEARMSTQDLGASRPIVRFSDLDSRWKNRRVEFILMRQ